MGPTWAQGNAGPLAAVGTAFTYQGYLTDDGSPANGSYDLQFRLFDALDGGTKIGNTVEKENFNVAEGTFTTEVNFGAGAFTGDARYLSVAVRPGNSTGSYTYLRPRQRLTPVPYALYAAAAPWSGLTGVPGGFADGTDDDTTYTAGNGLTLSGKQFRVKYGGDGGATTVARSDHGHLGETWNGTDNPLVIEGSFGGVDDAPLVLSNSQEYGDGLRVKQAGGSGVYVGDVEGDGLFVWNAARDGIQIVSAGSEGTYVSSAGTDGVLVGYAGEDGLHVDSAGDDGLHVQSASDEGVYVQDVGDDGFRVMDAGGNGLEVMGTGGDGVFVRHADESGVEVSANNSYAGVYVRNYGTGTGVYGFSDEGVPGRFTGDEYAYILMAQEDIGGGSVNVRFRVEIDGDVRADKDYYSGTGGYKTGYADLAEMLPATEGLEPADVLVVGADGRLALSGAPNASNVAGVYSSQPGFVAGYTMAADRVYLDETGDGGQIDPSLGEVSQELEEAEEAELNAGKIPLAVAGVVPVKVCAENGSIQPGDLLTTSSTPGHAMKAVPVDVAGIEIHLPGTIIGKALEPLTEDLGLIRVLVTLQ